LLPFDRRWTGATFETQEPQDLVHHDGVIEEGDDGTPTSARRTLHHVFFEDPTHKVRPDALTTRHYNRATEKANVAWIRHFILFHQKRHPAQRGAPEITAFLTTWPRDVA
jgi:hypothetical protein